MRKLYPNQIVVDIVERTPYGLWQKDGEVRAIAADGAAIDEVHDGRYLDLPFVVGEGANAAHAANLSRFWTRWTSSSLGSRPACWSTSAAGI